MKKSPLAPVNKKLSTTDEEYIFGLWDQGVLQLGPHLIALESTPSAAQLNHLRKEWEQTKKQNEAPQETTQAKPVSQAKAPKTPVNYIFTTCYEGGRTEIFIFPKAGGKGSIGSVYQGGPNGVWHVESRARKTRKSFVTKDEAIAWCTELWEDDCKSLEQTRKTIVPPVPGGNSPPRHFFHGALA